MYYYKKQNQLIQDNRNPHQTSNNSYLYTFSTKRLNSASVQGENQFLPHKETKSSKRGENPFLPHKETLVKIAFGLTKPNKIRIFLSGLTRFSYFFLIVPIRNHHCLERKLSRDPPIWDSFSYNGRILRSKKRQTKSGRFYWEWINRKWRKNKGRKQKGTEEKKKRSTKKNSKQAKQINESSMKRHYLDPPLHSHSSDWINGRKFGWTAMKNPFRLEVNTYTDL
ncbi:hypothetical protein CEXT_715511 [Caerostris extrusa]|uniref:Uncharacterized protein n=1 Tax=Caerostris extrusa TaxID=172846 RepID=A0AAV4Y049_CAEEX|nr:hypothetical protein CEXT_715511 [Caerostris extrusa]